MPNMTSYNAASIFIAISVIYVVGRVFGKIAKRLNQPTVLGEIIGGVIIGPTVLGSIFPVWNSFIFPGQASEGAVLGALIKLAGCVFLFSAGIEVHLAGIKKQTRSILAVSVGGIAFPFLLGFGMARVNPHLIGYEGGIDINAYALFIATALSISALPVIAKTLMDLKLYHTDIGMTIISAATINDVMGWVIFSGILKMIGVHANNGSAAWAEWLGIHAYLGAFLLGVAIGNSTLVKRETKSTISRLAMNLFAPIFFVSVGSSANFITHFDWALSVMIFTIACIGKVIGCGVCAKLSGSSYQKALAIGFGMNSRGAMEIVIGLSALQYGLISDKVFVSLVAMAIGTSLISGPTMRQVLNCGKKQPIPGLVKDTLYENL